LKVSNIVHSLINIATELVYRSVFIGSDSKAKHVSFVLYMGVALIEILATRIGWLGILLSLALLLTQSILQKTGEGLFYAFILSTIPAGWYFLTTLPFTGSIIVSMQISLRVMLISTSLTVFLQRINPMELAYLSKKIGLKEGALYFPLFWKITPHLMRDSQSALSVSSLKEEKAWKALAISFVALNEYNTYYDEGIFLKKENFRPTHWYDTYETLATTALLVIGACFLALVAVMSF